MEIFERLMKDIPAMDTAHWQDLIRRELRGKAWEDLLWEVEPGLVGQPFYHDEGKNYGGPLRYRLQADWMILETIPVDGQAGKANRVALEALQGGAQSLCFEQVRESDIPLLLDQVLLDVVPVFWQGAEGQEESAFRMVLSSWLSASPQGLSPDQYQGGWIGPMHHAVWPSQGTIPFWSVAIPSTGPVEEPSAQLARALQETLALIRQGADPRQMVVPLEIGDRFLVEIARLRALRIAWAHLMVSLGETPDIQPQVIATVRPDHSLAWEDHYISATVRGLSAVLGGADHLTILAPDHPAELRMRRLCRNVQHLMKEEAHLHRVLDPMAGSHAIEALTLALAERAWERCEV